MYASFLRLLALLQFLLILSPYSIAAAVVRIPPPRPAPPLLSSPTLRQLTQRSGYIFAGTVLAVELVHAKAQNEVATIRITFRVDQAIRGVSPKQTLAIHEWAGLWDSGERYRPGEQVLLFLYQTSKLGLTSPVNGSLGHFMLDHNGSVLLNAERLAVLQTGLPVQPPGVGKIVPVNRTDFVRAIQRVKE
jgi:hypothetical protein